ncbi:MAG: ACT domain-containing protein [Planctomycetes bacterium]|nr:ACT domain-containing protein [Planctomycetota bacterium]
MSTGFHFRIHDERLAIARLAHGANLPDWARGRFVNFARTPDELSIVCPEAHVPGDVRHERGKIAFGIVGTVPMTTIGVLAALCGALAEARVPVFVISTYDTDWLLVSADKFGEARRALESAGHRVDGELPAR